MVRISLCMIVRDEEELLGACLSSVRGLVDELVVCDTGSTDSTESIARDHGAIVFREPWADDFAAARNAAIARASGDWVLVLDADERLDLERHDVATARALLESFTRSRSECAGRVRIENRTSPSDSSEVDIVRFFRRTENGRYVGRVHEQWLLDIAGALTTPPRADTGLSIVHHGYRPDLVEGRGKLQRNLALLEHELRDRPDDGYAWYQLGRTLELGGRHEEALGALEQALSRALDSDEWAVHALELGAESLRSLGRSRQALQLVEAALPLAPERTDTLFLASLLALDCGDIERAETGFRACLVRGPARSGVERTAAAGSWAAAHNLAVICEHTERPAEAATLYQNALSSHPGHGPSREGLERLRCPLPKGLAIE